MKLQTRNLVLEFRDESDKGVLKIIDGINVRASITRTQGVVVNEAIIEVCNLSKVDIEYLTAWSAQSIERTKKRRIRVLSGYNDDVALLFDGDVIEAIPSSIPPDVWLKIKALAGYNLNGKIVSLEINGDTSISEVCELASKELEMNLNINIENDMSLKDFNYSGNLLGVVSKLNKFNGITAWHDLGTLYVRDVKAQAKTLEVHEDKEAKYISESSGMIGIPKVNFLGIEAKCLLDNRVKCGDVVYLDSKMFPTANGVYLVYQLNYDLALRETPFYVTIFARRLSSFDKYKPRS